MNVYVSSYERVEDVNNPSNNRIQYKCGRMKIYVEMKRPLSIIIICIYI